MAIPSLASPQMLAVQAKVNALQKQGMPPPQIAQMLQQEVLPAGNIPIAQLYQLLNYVKANAQQTQAPPNDSVAEQLADQVKNIAAHKKMGIAGLPQQPMAPPQVPSSTPPASPGMPVGAFSPPPPPQMNGVASLPQHNVGQPGMYSGGIVAFDEGGQTAAPAEAQVDPRYMQQLQAYVAKQRMQQAPHGSAIMIPAGAAGGQVRHFDDGGVTDAPEFVQPIESFFGQFQKKSDQPLADRNTIISPYGTPPRVQPTALQQPPASQPMIPGLSMAQTHGAPTSPMQMPPEESPPPPVPPSQPDNNPYLMNGQDPMRVTLAGMGLNRAGRSQNPGEAIQLDVPKARSISEITAEISDAMKKQGMGAAAAKYNDFLDEEQARHDKDNSFGKKMALANAGFAMAQAASIRGGSPGYTGSFMGAAAAGGSELGKELMANRDRMLQAEQNIAENRFKVMNELEKGKTGIARDAVLQARNEVQDHYRGLQTNASLAIEQMKMQVEREKIGADERLRMAMYTNKENPANQAGLAALWAKQNYAENDPRRLQAEQNYQYMTEHAPGYMAADLRGNAAMTVARERLAQSNPAYMIAQMKLGSSSITDEERSRAQAYVDDTERKAGITNVNSFDPSQYKVTPIK